MIETNQFVLSAVNLCLSGIGREPVPDLDSPDLDAGMALSVIEQVSLDLQTNGGKGWWFNTEYDWFLPLQANGEVSIPNNAVSLLQCRVGGFDQGHRLTIRGAKLYDTKNHTFDLSGITDRGVCVSLVILLPFQDLPVTGRSAIAWKSRFLFASDMVGNPEQLKIEEQNVGLSMQALTSEHSRSTRRNAFGDRTNTSRIASRIGGLNNFN